MTVRRRAHLRRSLSAVATAVIATTLIGPLPAPAAGADPATERAAPEPEAVDVLAVTQEFGSSADTGDLVVLRLTITADRLVDGEVTVTNESSRLVVRRDVQVAGGSTEEVLVVAPLIDVFSGPFVVSLVDGGSVIADDRVRFVSDSGTDVAAVMPVLASRAGDPPARVTLAGDLRRVDLVPLSLDVLELGPTALTQLDTVLATSDDLVALAPTARLSLFAWVERGGHLVLDDADDLSALPAEWRPDEAGYALAGRGEIRLADGVLTAGDWDAAIAPAALSPTDASIPFGADSFIDPRVTLAERAGVELPQLDRIVVALAVYVLLIGPVLYLVLRRLRRLTAAWIAIPVISVAMATGVVITSRDWGSDDGTTGATVVESGPVGSVIGYQQLLTSRGGGTASFTVPAGWAPAEPGLFEWWADTSTSRTAAVAPDGSTVFEARLEPGQVTVAGARGGDERSLLSVDGAIGDDGAIRGTVTNTSGADLVSVAVFAAGRGVLVGDLAAGATATYEIDDPLDDPDVFDSPVRNAWSDPERGLGFDAAPTPGIDLGIWTWFASSNPRVFPVGLVRAAGWTTGLTAPVTDGDASAVDNVALVTSIAPIANAAASLVPPAVRWEQIESAFDPRTGEPGAPVFRFVVPPDAPVDDLVLELPRGILSAEVLDARGRWARLDDRDDETREEVVDVAARHVIDGAIVVRIALDFAQNPDVQTIHPLLRGGDA